MGEEKKKKKEKKEKKEEKEEAKEASPPPKAQEKPKLVGNVFSLFSQQQIAEFKEAFALMDQNRDGILDEADLSSTYSQTGLDPDAKKIKEMIKESDAQLNFTHFLNMFGARLGGSDPEKALLDAFKMFDEDGSGTLDENYVKDLFMNVGDQFDKNEIKAFWKEAPISSGKLDYEKFVRVIKRGKEEAENA